MLRRRVIFCLAALTSMFLAAVTLRAAWPEPAVLRVRVLGGPFADPKNAVTLTGEPARQIAANFPLAEQNRDTNAACNCIADIRIEIDYADGTSRHVSLDGSSGGWWSNEHGTHMDARDIRPLLRKLGAIPQHAALPTTRPG